MCPATPRADARPRSTGCCNPRRRTTACGSTTTGSTRTFSSRPARTTSIRRFAWSKLGSIRCGRRKPPLGADAKGAKKIDKEIERQEDLLGELKDFAEKLERAAKLNFGNTETLNSDVTYEPDLNDGVVLNIAPLWELVPWKEAKNYWEELLEGKYEWSSMGKLLRKKGLVPC